MMQKYYRPFIDLPLTYRECAFGAPNESATVRFVHNWAVEEHVLDFCQAPSERGSTLVSADLPSAAPCMNFACCDISRTVATSVATLSGGVSGTIPWPGLHTNPGAEPAGSSIARAPAP